jgi:hypothetical protein
MSHNIIIKNKSKIEVIEEVCRFFESHYPEEWEWMRTEMKKLRSVSRAGYSDPQGRYTHVSMKVPSVLFLSVQHILPDFGKSAEDIALITKVCKEMDAHVPISKERPSLLIPSHKWEEIYGDKNAETPQDPDPQEDRPTATVEGSDAPE